MVKLSDRLQVIADFITEGETMADIGTDHGFLPMYLWERKICPYVILSDINKGPLEKASENINTFCPENIFDIRLGSGIETLKTAEVDTIVVAGMGGILITDILAADLEKTNSFKKIILQPRNAPEKLKKWLLDNDFIILDETLVRESKYIWEIILAVPSCQLEKSDSSLALKGENLVEEIEYELNPILFKKKDPLLVEYIKNKIRIEEQIVKNISRVDVIKDLKKLNASKERVKKLEEQLMKAIK